MSDPSSADDIDMKPMEHGTPEIPGKLIDEEILFNELKFDEKLPIEWA
jgi:hypothetical protein